MLNDGNQGTVSHHEMMTGRAGLFRLVPASEMMHSCANLSDGVQSCPAAGRMYTKSASSRRSDLVYIHAICQKHVQYI